MMRRIVSLAAAALLVASAAIAQPPPKAARAKKAAAPVEEQTPQPPQPPKPPTAPSAPAPPAPPPPARRGQPINVKVEVVVTDQRGSAAPIKKTISVIVGDQQGGMIRSDSFIPGVVGSVPLNVDANPEILPDGKIRLRLGLSYDMPNELKDSVPAQPVKTSIRESVALILESGKPMIVTQSADPVGDRQVMVEVKATILK